MQSHLITWLCGVTGGNQVADNQGNMTPATTEFILRARQLDLQAMQHLAARVSLVEVIGQLVHALQWERGASSIYLASGGERFEAERNQAVMLSVAAETTLKQAFAAQLHASNGASSQMMAMMGWVRLDLDTLMPFRAAIAQKTPRAGDAIGAFSRVIAGLIELVFQLADGATDPATSRLLVALVHLFQVKEEAGQERAVGAHLLASGVCTELEQQRFIHLIDAQERAAEVLLAFVDHDLSQLWDNTHSSANMAQLERLRRNLCMAKVGQALDATQSKTWFDVSSTRITALRDLELVLEQRLQASCAASIALAQQELVDSTGLVKRLLQNPSSHAQAVHRYYSEEGQPASVPVLTKAQPNQAKEALSNTEASNTVASLKDLLQKQSSKLAATEQELLKAKQAINERKVIERAKGSLMQRLGMTEDAAYRALQKTAMDHNKRLLDVAEATLAVSDMALAAKQSTQSGS